MLTVSITEDYLLIALQILDKSVSPAVASDPDAAPTATIYRDVDGAATLATEIAGGSATFSKQASELGFWGVGLPITSTTPVGRYWTRVTYAVGGDSYVDIINFEVVNNNRTLSNGLTAIG